MDLQGYYAEKTILVTGGAGAIGRNLVSVLAGLQAKKVIILDNLSSSFLWNIPEHKNIVFIQGDIRNEEDLLRCFRYKPTIIFNLAAFFANQNSVDYPLTCEDVNSKGTLKLLEFSVLSNNVERFVYTNSEGGAYGKDSTLPYKEPDISFKLSSPYYISKMAAEAYCNFYHEYHGLPVSTVRLFNSYGPGEVPGRYRNVIPNFIYWAMKKMPLPLTGNEAISRDFVFVEDIVEGILRAGSLQAAIGNSINIATGKEIRIYELAELINRITANPAGVRILNSRKWDTREKIVGSSEKCKEILRFSPSTTFESGLEKTFDWFQRNFDVIDQSVDFLPGINPALDV